MFDQSRQMRRKTPGRMKRRVAPSATRLTVPIRDVNRAHLERKAKPALKLISNLMKQSLIKGVAKVQSGPGGVPRIVIYVRSYGAEEARLYLPPTTHGFNIKVV